MATMKDIAKKSGVSQATVSRVLSNHPRVAPETKALVMDWVRKLDFEPNRAARALVSNKTHLIGLILPDIYNPYFNDITNHIEKTCYENGFDIIFGHSSGDKNKEMSLLKSLKSRGVEGILIAPVGYDQETMDFIKESGIKTVIITQIHEGYNCVGVNHYEGGRMAAQHFLDNGITRFTYLGEQRDEKFYGFTDRLEEEGFSREDLLNIPLIYSWEHYQERSYAKTNQFLNKLERFDGAIGVFASNDLTALGFMKAVEDRAFSVPGDFRVIGFDNTYMSQMTHPPLTSIDQQTENIGKLAISRMLELIDKDDSEPRKIVLLPRLVVRESA